MKISRTSILEYVAVFVNQMAILVIFKGLRPGALQYFVQNPDQISRSSPDHPQRDQPVSGRTARQEVIFRIPRQGGGGYGTQRIGT